MPYHGIYNFLGGSSICARVKIPERYWKFSSPSFVSAIDLFTHNRYLHSSSPPSPKQDTHMSLEALSFTTLTVGCTLDCLQCVGDSTNTPAFADVNERISKKVPSRHGSSSTSSSVDDNVMTVEDVLRYAQATGGLLSVRMQ